MARVFGLCVALVLIVNGATVPDALAQTPKGTGAEKKAATTAEKVDLNTATEKELEALPGVGPATAKKIIGGRPYTSAQDLSKAGVSAKTIQKLTPLVTVGGAAVNAPAPPAVAAAPEKPAASKSSPSTKSDTMEAKVPPAKGMVWVNTKSGVFHAEGDRWYGKTKEGKFMTEADALKAGYRAAKEGASKKEGATK